MSQNKKNKNTTTRRRSQPTATTSRTASTARVTRKVADSVPRGNEPLTTPDRYAVNTIAKSVAPAAFTAFMTEDAWDSYEDMAETVLSFSEALYREMQKRSSR